MSEFRSLDEMLRITQRRAQKITKRRRRWLVGAPLVAGAIAVAVVVAASNTPGDTTRVAMTDKATTTTTSAGLAPVESPSAEPPSSTAAPTTSTAVTSTTSTTPRCLNSTDRRCGPFRWDPQPTDKPTQIAVRTDPAAPRAGQEFFVIVTLTDPDRPLDVGEYTLQVEPFHINHSCCPGWGPRETVTRNCPAGYGPWTPPAPGPPGHHEIIAGPFTKADAGTYRIGGYYMPVVGKGATPAWPLPGESPPPDALAPGELPSCIDPYADAESRPITGSVTIEPPAEQPAATTT